MKIAIVGSRKLPAWRLARDLIGDFVQDLPRGTVIISGGAPGVDTLAAQAARAYGYEVVEFLPDWRALGKGAGFIRNRLIVDAADEVHAFWDGASRGTAHTVRTARRAGKPLTVYPLPVVPLVAPARVYHGT